MIIVGLGNPGKLYDGTRHNVGFQIVSQLTRELGGTPWKKDQGVSWSKAGAHILIEPQEMMNLSGQSLRTFLTYKHLLTTSSAVAANLLVIHDDLDLALGDVREQFDRTAAGHNGVQSIIDALGTKAFHRLRVGIGNNRAVSIPAEDYVLKPFTTAEQPIITKALAKAVEMVLAKVGQPKTVE